MINSVHGEMMLLIGFQLVKKTMVMIFILFFEAFGSAFK